MKIKVKDFISSIIPYYFKVLRTREDCPKCIEKFTSLTVVSEVKRKDNCFVRYPFKHFSSHVEGAIYEGFPMLTYYLVMPVIDYENLELKFDFFGFKNDADLRYFIENVYRILGYCTSDIALFELKGDEYIMIDCPYDPDKLLIEKSMLKRKK